jgi:hypothetical protein
MSTLGEALKARFKRPAKSRLSLMKRGPGHSPVLAMSPLNHHTLGLLPFSCHLRWGVALVSRLRGSASTTANPEL